MRVVAFANNRVGRDLVRFLAQAPATELVGLVVHTCERAASREQIIEQSGLEDGAILDAPKLRTEEGLHWLRRRAPDLGASIFFGHILKPAALELFGNGVVNIHPAYLPYNKGAFPNVWSIVDGTPAGVTLHFLDQGVDTGDIVARREVRVEPTDTGKALYHRLEEACVDLFEDTWPDILSGRANRTPQSVEEGTFHRSRDVEQIDPIDLDEQMSARDLINRLRARTFPPHEGCYFEKGGTKVFMRLQLWREGEDPVE
jgi:methionyl-tRNA formyltransferase